MIAEMAMGMAEDLSEDFSPNTTRDGAEGAAVGDFQDPAAGSILRCATAGGGER